MQQDAPADPVSFTNPAYSSAPTPQAGEGTYGEVAPVGASTGGYMDVSGHASAAASATGYMDVKPTAPADDRTSGSFGVGMHGMEML